MKLQMSVGAFFPAFFPACHTCQDVRHSQRRAYSLALHKDAEADLNRIDEENEDAGANIEVFLEEARNNQETHLTCKGYVISKHVSNNETPQMSTVLSVNKLRKSYAGNCVVDGISLSINKGECFGLLGPNGAGKTTTLRLMLGLIAPDAGGLRLLDHDVPQDARAARMRVGVVPQMDNLDPDFTVTQNLLVYGRYFGMTDAAIQARIPDLLEFANLAHKRDVRVPTLSGGMKRRLTLARALINDPEVLFLDEPTTGLDPQARHLIWQRLRELTAHGKTLILTTHYMDEAERLCHRLAVMDNGRIISSGSPRDLIQSNIESQVVEVFGEQAASWAQSHAAQHVQRFEVSGESVFCYVEDAQPLLKELQQHPELRYVHRPANLEDVFLKLTGREMRE